MLHHAKLKPCFWLMHMFKIFKFQFVVWLDLKSIEKIKEKEKIIIKEKSQSSPGPPPLPGFRPIWPTPARACLPFLSLSD
jgi:hypothetical protein